MKAEGQSRFELRRIEDDFLQVDFPVSPQDIESRAVQEVFRFVVDVRQRQHGILAP